MPREFIFILDRSGSMSGEPIRQARNALRACLRTLAPKDTFRILLFDNSLEWFQPEPAQAAQEQVQRADKYLDQVQGRGGTEIGMALKAALDLPQDAERVRFLIFLTDGAVSAELSILESIRKKIGTDSPVYFWDWSICKPRITQPDERFRARQIRFLTAG